MLTDDARQRIAAIQSQIEQRLGFPFPWADRELCDLISIGMCCSGLTADVESSLSRAERKLAELSAS